MKRWTARADDNNKEVDTLGGRCDEKNDFGKKVPMTIVTAADNGVVWMISLFQRCPRPFLLSSLLVLLLRGDGEALSLFGWKRPLSLECLVRIVR